MSKVEEVPGVSTVEGAAEVEESQAAAVSTTIRDDDEEVAWVGVEDTLQSTTVDQALVPAQSPTVDDSLVVPKKKNKMAPRPAIVVEANVDAPQVPPPPPVTNVDFPRDNPPPPAPQATSDLEAFLAPSDDEQLPEPAQEPPPAGLPMVMMEPPIDAARHLGGDGLEAEGVGAGSNATFVITDLESRPIWSISPMASLCRLSTSS